MVAPRGKDYFFALNRVRADSRGYLENLKSSISQSLRELKC